MVRDIYMKCIQTFVIDNILVLMITRHFLKNTKEMETSESQLRVTIQCTLTETFRDVLT